MKIKLLFQGDSITDAGRNRSDYHDLGHGYPKYAAKYIAERFPDVEFEFIDLGIGGNQTIDLVNRLQSDFVDIQPDIVSVLIGINDVWHHAGDQSWIDNGVFEERYRTVLTAIKEKTDAKIMMMEPFLIPVEDKLFFRVDLAPKIEIIRKLAREFADAYIPMDGLFAMASVGTAPTRWAEDGVHPTKSGAELMAKYYLDAISPIIDSLK